MKEQKAIKLSDLITDVRDEMRRNKYAESTIAAYEKTWRMLMSYAVKKNRALLRRIHQTILA